MPLQGGVRHRTATGQQQATTHNDHVEGLRLAGVDCVHVPLDDRVRMVMTAYDCAPGAILHTMSTSGSILGTRVLRTEDPKLLTIGGDYIGDLALEGAVHLQYVRSSVAHARLTDVDVTEARQAPGVLAVYTAADMDLAPAKPGMPFLNQKMRRPFLAIDTVRFVGDLIALVVAETKAQAVDAAELVVVDYEPLEPLLDLRASQTNTNLLHADAETNVVFAMPGAAADDTFADCEVVIEQVILNPRMAPAPLEPRTAAARWEADGRLTYWACGQGAHSAKDGLAKLFGLEKGMVRVITPDVGGGFGAKQGNTAEEFLTIWVARKLGRPAQWVETRTENLLGLVHGRGQVQTVKMGGTKDGHISAYRLEVLQDSGAYADIGAMLPFMTKLMASGTYDIAKVEVDTVSLLTTTTPTGAFRGAGRPEATAAIERALDVYAAEVGLDPVEIRRRNLLKKDQFPLTTPTGANYDSGDYVAALDQVLAAADYAGLRAEQARRRAAGDRNLMGIGVSCYVEITNPMGGGEHGSVEITADGRAIVRTGSSAHGQGHHTVFAMLVSDRTGIAMDRIEVRHGDTDDVPRGGGTGGSRSLQAGGTAVVTAADQVIAKAKEKAADLLEASVDDIVLTAGAFHVAGVPTRSLGWADVAASTGGLKEEADLGPMPATFPFGTHISVVEVDADTGQVKIVRHISCDDAGVIVNPLIVDGQVHGGVASGIAQALMEEIRYDEAGNPVTSNLADYAFISSAELPSFERISQETPTPHNPLGAKGIGEAGTIGATPAVHNAVVDALSHLGIRHVDMPCTPERVWRAIQGAKV